ncbi:MAG: DUF3299 domain-containing protein [Hyphomonas sp.]|jgi:hypothetical protein|nr:DUF3299 domain-containing protein [Hyphomonas sp.]
MLLLLVAACSREAPPAAPPPMPEGAKTADFERDAAEAGSAGARRDAGEFWGVAPGEALPVTWADLMPAGAEEELARQQAEFYAELDARYQSGAVPDPATIEEGSELDFMPQLGTFDAVTELDGVLVRIPGYVVPFDFDPKARHTTFLFVPYMGACIHTPPPPPNQIIFVRAAEGVTVPDIWAPYYLEGTFSSGQFLNDVGNAAYSVDLASLEPYPVMEP